MPDKNNDIKKIVSREAIIEINRNEECQNKRGYEANIFGHFKICTLKIIN
jgi:hypothetical protein